MRGAIPVCIAALVLSSSCASGLAARDVVSNMDEAFSRIDGYTCTADAHYVKGKSREDKIYKISFRRPELVRVEVLKGDSGAVAVLDKEGKVKGIKGGWLSWIVLTLDLDDPLVTTIRGHTLKQSHFRHFIDEMKKAVDTDEVSLEAEKLDGRDYMALNTAKGSDTKTVLVDPDTWLIKKIVEREGSVEVVDVTYYDIKPNIALDDGLFKL